MSRETTVLLAAALALLVAFPTDARCQDEIVVPDLTEQIAPPSLVEGGTEVRITDPLPDEFVESEFLYDEYGWSRWMKRPRWLDRASVFADYLYIRPRDSEITFAEPLNGNTGIQVGRTGVTDPDYSSAYRIGFSKELRDCSSEVRASWTHFENRTTDSIGATNPIVIRSLVTHPAAANTASDELDAIADYNIDFDLLDLDYRWIYTCCETHQVSFLLGLRYARLKENFASIFADDENFTGIVTQVDTEIDFDGGGLRIGTDFERALPRCGWVVYGGATANFLAGDYRADYFMGSSTDPVIAETSWKSGRIISILDMELGVRWVSKCGRLRVSGGYMVSAWFNTVKSDEFINSVQESEFEGLGDTTTFDGITSRVEWWF